jgi:hypothetical protein
MESKKIYFEIIETKPKILESNSNLKTILRFFLYYTFSIFYLIKKFAKKPIYFFKNIIETNGPENLESSIMNHKTSGKSVKKTISEFFSGKEAENILKSLLKNELFKKEDLNKINLPITIKKRTEFLNTIPNKEISIEIIYPFFIKKILNLIK